MTDRAIFNCMLSLATHPPGEQQQQVWWRHLQHCDVKQSKYSGRPLQGSYAIAKMTV